jgi:hypothetical protein
VAATADGHVELADDRANARDRRIRGRVAIRARSITDTADDVAVEATRSSTDECI